MPLPDTKIENCKGPEHFKSNLPDIGHLATWMVSSHKLGYDVNCLRDDNPDTFWQSDALQPHHVTLQFMKKVQIQAMSIRLNIEVDDSYTPIKLLVRAGTGLNDLQEVKTVTMEEPMGWVTFDVGLENRIDHEFKPLSVFAIQILVAQNHMNGKDTHVRGLKVLGAKEALLRDDDMLPFTSREFRMHEFIR